MRNLIVVLAAGFFAMAVSAGEVYKWVDKDGRVHYGDKPKTMPAEPVVRQPGQLPEAPSDPEADQKAAARKAACEAKKKQLESYRKATVINETDSLGNTRELSAADRQKLISITEQQVTTGCGPLPPTPPPSEAAPDASPALVPAADAE